jgi:O-antigen/teichoic acid export membrane protein
MHYFKIAKNTFYQSFAKLFSSFVGFLITVFIAKSFGVLGYGDFIKITSFVAPFYLIVDFGLNAFFLQLKKKENSYSQLLWLRIYFSIIVFLLINLISLFLPYNQQTEIGYSGIVKFGIFLFSISVFSQAIIYSSLAIFQQKLKYFYYMLSVLLGSLINLILVFLFISSGQNLNYAILAFVISSFFTAFFASTFTKDKISKPKLNLDFSRNLIKMSSPLALMLIFNLVYFRIDSIILAFFKPSADVGIYGLAYKFFDFLISLPLFLSNSLYPLLLENQKNLRNLTLIIRNYSLIFIISGIFLIFPFWFLAPLFSIVKSEFTLSVFPFRILLLSLPIFFATSFFQWILIAFNKQKYLLAVYAFSTIINVVLNLFFIPKFSYAAAAIITLVSEVFVLILLAIKVFPVKNIRRGVQT